MKYLKKNFLNPLVYNYFFVFILLFSNVMFINVLVNPAIKLFTLWGVLLILYAFWNRRIKLTLPFFVFSAFLVSVLITNIINYPSNFYLNSVMFLFTSCYILVNISSFKIDISKVLFFNNIYIILTVFLALLSLISLFLNISYKVSELAYGYHWGVLYGVFSNPNSGSIICMFAIPLIILNYKCYHFNGIEIRKSLKIAYRLGIVIISVYLFLVDSRGALLCLLGFLSSFIILYTFKFIKNKNKVAIYILTLLLTIGFGILVIKSPLTQIKTMLANQGEPVQENTGQIENNNNSIPPNIPIENEGKQNNSSVEKPAETPEKPTEPVIPEPPEPSRKENNISSSRFILWQGAVEGIKKYPLFGVGQANVLDLVKSINTDQSIETISAGGVHNGYLDLLVSSGIVGFVLFSLGILLLFIKAMKLLIKINNVMAPIIITLISLIIGVFVNNLVETSMIMAIFITTEMLWLHIGILNNLEESMEVNDVKIC